MTAFGALYYTDCRPGEGLLGGAGFQFQAVSAGVPAPAAALVQRAALYDPPVPWMRARRPVEDYPPSLAHCTDGAVYATAAGRYLGAEANGTREGNQFTHAITTDDITDYGLVRPAQLWGASWWATGPAPTTTIDPVPGPPAPGAWTADAVRDRIAAAPRAADGLAALLSALQRLTAPPRTPVLMVCADAAVAACWMAGATLLLPRDRALRVTFKIFAADARGGQHDVVVLHPDWAGPLAEHRGGDSGRVLFDLVDHRYATVEVTASARFWADRFLAADPFDVADAVEHAAALALARTPPGAVPAGRGGAAVPEPAVPEPDDPDDRLAAAVLHLGESVPTVGRAQELAHWLTSVPAALDDRDLGRLAESVLAAAPHDVPVLRDLYRALAKRASPAVAARVSAGVLRAEIREVLAASGQAGVTLVAGYPPVPTDVPGAEGMTAILAAELARARPDQVPGLLSLASRHRLRPDPPRDALHAFARWWVEHPTAVEHSPAWTLAGEVLDLVRAVLDERLRRSADPASVEDAIERHWSTLLAPTVVHPGDPVDRCLRGLAYRDEPAAGRPALLRRILDESTTDRGEPGAIAFHAAFRRRSAGRHLDEVLDLTRALSERGLPLGPALGAAIGEVIEGLRDVPTADAFRLLDQVVAAGHPLPTGVGGWQAQDRRLTAALAALGEEGGADLGAVDARLLRVRGDDVTRAVLGLSARATRRVLIDLPDDARDTVLDLVRARWPELGAAPDSVASARALAVGFRVVSSADPEFARFRTQFGPAFRTIATHLPRRGRLAVDRAYDPRRLGEKWWSWLRELDGGSSGVLGRARSMFGRKG